MPEMSAYERIISDIVDKEGITVNENILPKIAPNTAGLYVHCEGKPPQILLNPKKANKLVLAEELGHLYTGTACVIDAKDIFARKREIKGRRWAYENYLKLEDIAKAWLEKGNRTLWDTAEALDVTEYQLSDALEYYRVKYGSATKVAGYYIQLEPYFDVI